MSEKKIDFLFDKSKEPDQDHILRLLGQNAERLNELDSFCENKVGQLIYEWKFYTKKSGRERPSIKKRNLFFLTPKKDLYSITFVFGDRAVEAAENSELPERIKTELKQARKYMEGRGIRIDVTSGDELEIVKKLVRIKTKN